MEYTALIEKGKDEQNCGAWAPDLPGCVSVGDSPEEAQANIKEAIEFHLRGLREDGLPIPEPSITVTVRVA